MPIHREYAALHDWLTAQALDAAVDAEQECTILWRRHCDRLRHELPAAHGSPTARITMATRLVHTGRAGVS